MIIVDGKELDWIRGEAIVTAIKRAKSYHPFMIISLNGKMIRKEKWGEKEVSNGDEINTLLMIAGG
ncbi:MAG: MoaD/ThiS family protein [Thermodesulfobacteriota bacterium]|nr:MoaD/ThiS family protein [Thermodesulfobacteriota bacterium]